MIYHYEDRIRRLLGALQELATGKHGTLIGPSIARQAVDTDAKLVEQYRREVQGVVGVLQEIVSGNIGAK